jgi:hypothetical protein
VNTSTCTAYPRHQGRAVLSAFLLWAVATVGTDRLSAQTYISAEPIPSEDIVGSTNLAKILGIGYPNLALWSERLLCECHLVQDVIYTLADNRAITTVTLSNTRFAVAAGGFEGLTDPSYVFTIEDAGPYAASAADIYVLDNALGYVLNQSGTAQFSLRYDANNPYEFPLDYAVVTFAEHLSGERAAKFFDYLGTIDPALWTGTNAGFTQIDLPGSHRYNSLLFLIGDVSTEEFTTGLFAAASTTPRATYSPLTEDGRPTTATAGAAFPGNDWLAFLEGDAYLMNLGNPPAPLLLKDLAVLRQKHLQAVANLLKAIDRGDVERYLTRHFKCPERTEPRTGEPGSPQMPGAPQPSRTHPARVRTLPQGGTAVPRP